MTAPHLVVGGPDDPHPDRCTSMGTGVDGRGNRCAKSAGHAPPHSNRSGRVKWTDDGSESVRLMGAVKDPAHRDFAKSISSDPTRGLRCSVCSLGPFYPASVAGSPCGRPYCTGKMQAPR